MIDNNITAKFPAHIVNDFQGSLPNWWNDDIPLLGKKAAIVYDAFISCSDITGWPHSVATCVNSSVGDEILESHFMRTGKINKLPSNYLDQLKNAVRLKGKYIYLGWLITHYGHFITESLSRLWYLLQDNRPTKYIVHANFKSFNALPSYVINILSTFDITEKNLIIINTPIIVDELHCPIQALRCDNSIGYHAKGIYEHITTSLLIKNAIGGPKKKHEKIYLSRESLSTDPRRFNEKDVCNIFEKYGFKIFSPEKLSLIEQLDIYYHAKQIAGPVGSGLHNAVFMKNPDKTLVISPNNFLFKNDCLLSLANGYKLSYHLVDNGSADKVIHKPWYVDSNSLKNTIEQWLDI